jgi:hypothetical protein
MVKELCRGYPPNPSRHRIAARLRMLLNLKSLVWAARGALGRWAVLGCGIVEILPQPAAD